MRHIIVYITDDSHTHSISLIYDALRCSNSVHMLITYNAHTNKFLLHDVKTVESQLKSYLQTNSLDIEELLSILDALKKRHWTTSNQMKLCCDANICNSSSKYITQELIRIINLLRPQYAMFLANNPNCLNDINLWRSHRSTHFGHSQPITLKDFIAINLQELTSTQQLVTFLNDFIYNIYDTTDTYTTVPRLLLGGLNTPIQAEDAPQLKLETKEPRLTFWIEPPEQIDNNPELQRQHAQYIPDTAAQLADLPQNNSISRFFCCFSHTNRVASTTGRARVQSQAW